MANEKKYLTEEDRLAAIRANARAYYHRNKEKASASARAWHAANKDKPGRIERQRANAARMYQRRRDEIRARNAAWYAANRDQVIERSKERHLRDRYGVEDYEAMLAAQGGRCACCGTDKPGGHGKRFAVDHCHDSLRVRGLLCQGCNTGLGMMGDSIERLRMAISYLEAQRGR